MAIVKSKKKTSISTLIDVEVFSELEKYAQWADVGIDDVIEQALEFLFSKDSEWINAKSQTIQPKPIRKTLMVREIYAEIAAGKHSEFLEKAGYINPRSVFNVIKKTHGEDAVAYGTVTSQTSWCNRLIRNQANERDNDPTTWTLLCERIPGLRESQKGTESLQ